MSSWRMAQWDAVETLARIGAKEVSAREVLEAAIERSVDGDRLGGLVSDTYERARAGVGVRRGPLAGVPTLIKDLARVRGVATGFGSAAAGRHASRRSDPFVDSLEATGVSCIGKSATPELGLTGTTEPLGQAPCRNPWAPDRSAGGSSGGAAALVAAGVVPIAHASDGGGSIRVPASCCGLVGLKVSRWRMDMAGSALLPVNVAVDGCVSTTVRDTVAFWQALESVRPSPRVAPIGPVAPEPGRRLRMGVFATSPLGTPVHPDNREAALAAGRLCEHLGHEVEEIACPFGGQVIDDFLLYWTLVAWAQVAAGRYLLHRSFDPSKLDPWTRALSRTFASKPWAVVGPIRRLRAFGRTHAKVMKRYDVLVCPTVGEPPPALGHLSPDVPFELAHERLRRYLPFTPIQNVSGAPAISLPLGRSAGGLPLGVQFAAAYGMERLLLELASSLEAAQPWPRIAPREAWAGEVDRARATAS